MDLIITYKDRRGHSNYHNGFCEQLRALGPSTYCPRRTLAPALPLPDRQRPRSRSDCRPGNRWPFDSGTRLWTPACLVVRAPDPHERGDDDEAESDRGEESDQAGSGAHGFLQWKLVEDPALPVTMPHFEPSEASCQANRPHQPNLGFRAALNGRPRTPRPARSGRSNWRMGL